MKRKWRKRRMMTPRRWRKWERRTGVRRWTKEMVRAIYRAAFGT